VEPFGGAAGVLLQKPRAYAEVYNDLDGDVVNFFRVVRDPVLRAALEQALTLTPYAREEFDQAWEAAGDPVERARRIAIRAQMGFGSAGATKGSTGFRIDTKRAYSTAQQLWAEYPSVLSAVGMRFTGILIENRPAIEVMRQHDSPETLHYVDPPYLHETRVIRGQPGGNSGYYKHEMTHAEHEELLAAIADLEGMVLLSGYDSDLYRDVLSGWQISTTQSLISGSRGSSLRQEVLWRNPACDAELSGERSGLFSVQGGIDDARP
jgi:DNA adenine methylase